MNSYQRRGLRRLAVVILVPYFGFWALVIHNSWSNVRFFDAAIERHTASGEIEFLTVDRDMRDRERDEQNRMLKIVGACSFLGGWLILIILIRIMLMIS